MRGSSPTSEPWVSVTDVKQYFFCPRVIFFKYALGLDEAETEAMREGKEAHEEVRRREERRLTLALRRRWVGWRKEFGVRLSSARLGLVGVRDDLVTNGREYVPVEYKSVAAPLRVPLGHYYQLVAYAILVEESYSTLVRRGLLYYSGSDTLIERPITREAKEFTVEVVKKIRRIMEGEEPEVRAPRWRCAGCGFLRHCGRA